MNESSGVAARHFHNRTKYVYVDTGQDDDDILMGEAPDLGPAMGEQDPALEPFPFKVYPGLASIPLPGLPLKTDIPALNAIATSASTYSDGPEIDVDLLGTLLLRTAGLLKEWTVPNGRTFQFRSAGCTGARYHLELYVVAASVGGLNSGIYHYDPQDHALRQLREADHRGVLVEATGNNPAAANAQVLVICTSEFWRNAWRYQERAYRHAYWDLGTLATNLLALASSANQPATVLMGFADDAVNQLIGVDGEREAALAVFALGEGGPATSTPSQAPAPLRHIVKPSSRREIDFPDIQQMHQASSLSDGAGVARWRSNRLRRVQPEVQGKLVALAPMTINELPDESVEEVIIRRRSNRHYAVDEPLSYAEFSRVISNASKPAVIDAIDSTAEPLADLYLIVNNVEGLSPGKYVLHRDLNAIELLETGDFRDGATHIACGQEYAGDAHVNVYLLADLDSILERYGDRGYRLVQFEAALTGGRIQLAAHALRLGAVGSTSADDDVTAFFSPHAAGKSFMFVAVFGIRAPRS